MSAICNHKCIDVIEKVGFIAIAGGLTAVIAIAISCPISAVGGLIVGVTGSLIGRSVWRLSQEILNALKLSDSYLAQTIALAIALFASIAAASFCVTAAGFSLGLGGSAILILATAGIGIGGVIFIGAIFPSIVVGIARKCCGIWLAPQR